MAAHHVRDGPVEITDPVHIARLLSLAMAHVLAGKLEAEALAALTDAARVYVSLQELTEVRDIAQQLEEIERWKKTFQRPAALSA